MIPNQPDLQDIIVQSDMRLPPIYLDGEPLAGRYTISERAGGRMRVTLPDGRWGWVTSEGKLGDPDQRFVLHLVT
jgi:hypothetical protein